MHFDVTRFRKHVSMFRRDFISVPKTVVMTMVLDGHQAVLEFFFSGECRCPVFGLDFDHSLVYTVIIGPILVVKVRVRSRRATGRRLGLIATCRSVIVVVEITLTAVIVEITGTTVFVLVEYDVTPVVDRQTVRVHSSPDFENRIPGANSIHANLSPAGPTFIRIVCERFAVGPICWRCHDRRHETPDTVQHVCELTRTELIFRSALTADHMVTGNPNNTNRILGTYIYVCSELSCVSHLGSLCTNARRISSTTPCLSTVTIILFSPRYSFVRIYRGYDGEEFRIFHVSTL